MSTCTCGYFFICKPKCITVFVDIVHAYVSYLLPGASCMNHGVARSDRALGMYSDRVLVLPYPISYILDGFGADGTMTGCRFKNHIHDSEFRIEMEQNWGGNIIHRICTRISRSENHMNKNN
jgi:hypothetical protein